MGQAGKPHNGKFVSYLRVSTLRRGRGGGGLDAQREAIQQFLNGGQWQMVGEFVETESGHMVRRPQLTAALALCKKEKATLVVARLDRLYRNWAVMGALVESGVNVLCVDNPHATKQVIQTMAAFAEMERDLISERTKAGLKQAKRRGVKLGNPDPAAAAAHGRRTPRARPMITLRASCRMSATSCAAGTILYRRSRTRLCAVVFKRGAGMMSGARPRLRICLSGKRVE